MKTLPSTLFSAPDRINKFKELIRQTNTQLELKFDPAQPVNSLLREKSDYIDNILALCWQHFLEDSADNLCLIAVGGYGRRELFPYSDIDILILLDEEVRNDHQDKLSAFSNFLWDIGLKPGQSVRTVSECVQAATEDQTIMTSLLEQRLICGNQTLFTKEKEQISNDNLWPSALYFQAKMEEQRQRYIKFHETAYNLEPNIKEGPGGLRDMQNIAWVFKRHYGTSTLKELITYDFLPLAEYEELMADQQLLWQLRYALHLITGRCEDRLLFDYQRELAEKFGFKDHQGNYDVEQFMQHYYRTVVGLERLNEMLLQLFRERFVSTEQKNKVFVINAAFRSVNGYIEATDNSVFQHNPLTLLEIFLLQQQIPSIKGVRATTIRLIRENLHLIDEKFRNNKKACRIFIEIFKQPRGLTHQLRRMNRYGILAAYLPCFSNIVARMQYDLFHIYTVDEHTLFVIRNLRRFSLQKHNGELPFCNNIFLLINKPKILYLAGLFHDIAKGKGGDHSKLGENIVRNFCIRHDLSRHDSKLLAWLVRNHLIMSMTAQRKDISDPEIIHEFAVLVGSIEYLNYLYLLTVADIRATNPKLWNSWKDSLLKELYTSTHKALHRGLKNPIALCERIKEVKFDAHEGLIKLGLNEPIINKAWKHLSNDYFARYSADEIIWQTVAIASCSENEFPLVLLRPQNQRGSAEVFIYTRDLPQIFTISTATLDQLGLTILDARIVTIDDTYALNSFQVLEQSGEAINDLFRELHICASLRNNLRQGFTKKQENFHHQSRQAKHFPISSNILFHNNPQFKHTMLELITTDQSGLLSKIGQVFRDQEIILHNAKVTTIGSRVEDMFYISDRQTRLITNANKQNQLRKAIFEALGDPGSTGLHQGN